MATMATPSAAGRGRWASAPAMAAVVLVLVAAAAVASSLPIRPPTPSSSSSSSSSSSGRRSAVVSAAGGGIVRGGENAAADIRRRRCRRGGRIIVADEVRVRLNSSPDGGGDGDGGDDVFVDADRGSDGGGARSRRKKPRLPDRNLYDVLGADPSMSRGEIKRLYIALARETHPDSAPTTTGTGGGGGISADDDRFNDIARAWTVLSDPKLRRAHDRELAAADFRDDVVRRAGEAAREYGPAARKFYDEFAIPLLRRGAATTVAGWSAAVAEAAATASNGVGLSSSPSNDDGGGGKDGRRLSGATLSEVVREVSEMERRSNAGVGGGVGGGGDGMEDFGRAFRRVIEAGRNATRQIDGMELGEKSLELRRRAEETKGESMAVLGRLTEIKSERLRLTFRTPAADFTSSDAIQYLGGFADDGRGDDADDAEGFALVRRMTSRHPVRQDIEALAAAEEERDGRAEERSGVDRQIQERRMALLQAENNAVAAVQAEERARKMLGDAQRQVAESQRVVADAQKSIRDLDGTMRRADQDLSKADATLKRKRDVVRRELKRKADEVEGSVFDRLEDRNGSTEVRLNPGFNRSSMDSMGFQGQNNVATVEALRQDEQRIEGDFLQLVDKASRLMSRSERLRLRSEELIGRQQQQQQQLQQKQQQQQQQQPGDTGGASFR